MQPRQWRRRSTGAGGGRCRGVAREYATQQLQGVGQRAGRQRGSADSREGVRHKKGSRARSAAEPRARQAATAAAAGRGESTELRAAAGGLAAERWPAGEGGEGSGQGRTTGAIARAATPARRHAATLPQRRCRCVVAREEIVQQKGRRRGADGGHAKLGDLAVERQGGGAAVAAQRASSSTGTSRWCPTR